MNKTGFPAPDATALRNFRSRHTKFLNSLDLNSLDLSDYSWIIPEHIKPVRPEGRDLVLPVSPRDYVRFLAVAGVVAPHDEWMAYVSAALDVVYVSPDGLSKLAWSLPWDAQGLDKLALLLSRGAKLAHVLNMATLLDTRSNHIMVKRYVDKYLDMAPFREKTDAQYAAFLKRFDVARHLSPQEKALVLLNCKWRPEALTGKPQMIADCGVDWNMVLRQSLVKLFFGFNRMQTDDVSWRRGHPVFGAFVTRFRDAITVQLTEQQLTQVAIHLACWKPVPDLHLLPLVELGARGALILQSLPKKDAYYRACFKAFADTLNASEADMLEKQYSVRQYFDTVKDKMAPIERKRFANRILPYLGRHVITHLTSDKIAPLHFRLKSTPRIANLVLDDITRMVARAHTMKVSRLDGDPCNGIARYLPDLQTLKPSDLPRAYAPEADQYDGTSDQYFHDAYYHTLDPGDAVLARQPQAAGDTNVPRGAEGVLVRDGGQWAVDWDGIGRTVPVDAQNIFKRDLLRGEPSDALKAAQAALPPDHYVGMQGEVFHLPDWAATARSAERRSAEYIQTYLDDIYSRFLFQPTYIFLKVSWISKGATGPVRQKIVERFHQIDWINLEQLDRIATSMQYTGLLKRRYLDDNPVYWELEQHLSHIRTTFDPTVPPIRSDLAEIKAREARTFYHLDASQRIVKGIQGNPELFPDTSLATVFRDHLWSAIFEDEVFMDYARSVDYDGSGYFMTHICFYLIAQDDYNLYPILFNYMEAIQIYQLEQGNVEVAGEVLTCLYRVLDRTPENSPIFASSLKYLLETAGAEANWPDRLYTHLTPYKMLHVPWTAIQDIYPQKTKAENRTLQQMIVRDIPDWTEVRAKFRRARR